MMDKIMEFKNRTKLKDTIRALGADPQCVDIWPPDCDSTLIAERCDEGVRTEYILRVSNGILTEMLISEGEEPNFDGSLADFLSEGSPQTVYICASADNGPDLPVSKVTPIVQDVGEMEVFVLLDRTIDDE